VLCCLRLAALERAAAALLCVKFGLEAAILQSMWRTSRRSGCGLMVGLRTLESAEESKNFPKRPRDVRCSVVSQ